MSAPTGSQTVTYRKPGVVPPVYLAGSFTDPQWQPREMQHTRGADDEYVFTSSVQGAPGKEYQYKFRIGQADQWVIDDTVPASTDTARDKTNILRIPSAGASDNPPVDNNGTATSTMAQDLGNYNLDSAGGANAPGLDYAHKGQDPRTCLFSHEELGPYEFGEDDDTSNDSRDVSEPLTQQRSTSSHDSNHVDVDINDPTLEEFPSDRASVMDALRTIQSSIGEDKVQCADDPSFLGRRKSNDSGDDNSISGEPLSPKTTTLGRSRDSRPSYTNQAKSAASLGPIAE